MADDELLKIVRNVATVFTYSETGRYFLGDFRRLRFLLANTKKNEKNSRDDFSQARRNGMTFIFTDVSTIQLQIFSTQRSRSP